MNVKLRSHIAGIFCAAVILAVSLPAQSQGYPNKPVRMIIPFGAGGSTDVLIRIVATKLPQGLGEQVVIDNRTGAGGLIGTGNRGKIEPRRIHFAWHRNAAHHRS